MDGVGVRRNGAFWCKTFDFEDVAVSEEFRVAAPIGVDRLLFVGDPFGEKEISKLITDPTFGMAEADFESFGILLLRESPQISAEVDAGVC